MRIREHIFLFLIFLTGCSNTSIFAQTCLQEGIHFKSQAEIDAFGSAYPGCTTILGNVTISQAPQEKIRELSGLAQLQSIKGGVNISGNDQLKNLEGLQNIKHIGASLRIANNIQLQKITALSSIEFISGDLSISSNPRLSNLKGLRSLTNIDKHLIVTDNKSLPSLEGLENLHRIGRDLLIQQNAFLQSLVGLNALDTIGAHVVIDANDNLSSLKGLDKLTFIRGNLQVVNNQKLSTIAALSALRHMGGLLQILNNPFLKSLVGIDSINGVRIEDLAILFSATLSICHVRSICDYLADPANQAAIRNNANGCGSREEILASCDHTPVNSTPNIRGMSLFYPNPTNGFVTIRGAPLTDALYHVTDLAGKRYKKSHVSNNVLDLTELASGTYVVEVTTSTGEEMRELVIKM